jgi:hypothetical protein
VNIYITEDNLFGEWLYRIMLDGQKYDQFFSKSRLTWSEQIDVVEGYQEGLDV